MPIYVFFKESVMVINAGAASTALTNAIAANTGYYAQMSAAGSIALVAAADNLKNAWEFIQSKSPDDVYKVVGSVAVGIAVVAAIGPGAIVTVPPVVVGIAAH